MSNPHQALIDKLIADQKAEKKRKSQREMERRNSLPPEERAAFVEASRLRQRKFRAEMSEDKKAEYNAKHRKYMKENPERYLEYQQQLRYKYKARAVKMLGGKCVDCEGVYHPAAFDFHHKDASDKYMNVASLLNRGWPKIEEEVKKCELLCSNCHRVRHAIGYNTILKGDQIALIKPED